MHVHAETELKPARPLTKPLHQGAPSAARGARERERASERERESERSERKLIFYTSTGTPIVNALFAQRNCLVNIMRACVGQYLYFCTSKASTFVPVKQVLLYHYSKYFCTTAKQEALTVLYHRFLKVLVAAS